MRGFLGLLVLFAGLERGFASPSRKVQSVLQVPPVGQASIDAAAPGRLHGRFLHITGKYFATSPAHSLLTAVYLDLHLDPFYKIHSSTEEERACHRGSGPAGTYGAETSDCDSPYALINETFKWIESNLKDTIDFVVWTGDSARHDNDERIPRSPKQVLEINKFVVGKFVEVFGNGKDDSDPTHGLTVPIVPTFGNNDILPHNILVAGPNRWFHEYLDVWRRFIPEEQRHGFQRGGWFWVEVIPQKLAVFSLNTLYFFDHNTAVDGCAAKSEPGWEHMEWLRIQLQFMRERGMKVILMGHVPPARTDSKQLWDETCWQKYTLWLKQYRDVVISGMFGHMNIDHFLLQDTKDIDLAILTDPEAKMSVRTHLDDELTIYSAADYLQELREGWSKLPDPSLAVTDELDDHDDDQTESRKKRKGDKSKKHKGSKEIGGPWGERYQLTNIGPSVVPNFFPTLRVIEYNITGLEDVPTWISVMSAQKPSIESSLQDLHPTAHLQDENNEPEGSLKKHKKKKPKDPNLNIPPPPSKSSPPGPAYSPQTLTLLGYTQYFANLTQINNDIIDASGYQDSVDTDSWHGGKHQNKHPNTKLPHPKEFKYEVEYSTFNDTKFKLEDLTVRSYLKLAHRIGQYKPPKSEQIGWDDSEEISGGHELQHVEKSYCVYTWSDLIYGVESTIKCVEDAARAWLAGTQIKECLAYIRPDISASGLNGQVKGHKKKKGHKRKKNKTWISFIKRAFIGTLDDDKVKKFELARARPALEAQQDDL